MRNTSELRWNILTQRPDKFSAKRLKNTRIQAELCNSNHGERIERNLGGRTTESRWRTAYTKMAAECLVAWNLILPHRSPGSDSGPLSFTPSFFLFPLWPRLSSTESSFPSSRTTSTVTSRLGNSTAANYTRTPSIFHSSRCGNLFC